MWEGDRRDAVRLSIGTYELLITGGMSWGDGPSDAYDALSTGALDAFIERRKREITGKR